MKLLTLDIETKPHTVLVWSLHGEQHIGLNQIVEPGGAICFAAKWHGERKVMFHSDYHDGREGWLRRIHELMSEADGIITYNGQRFDITHLNWEFEQLNLGPPAPHKDIDLYRTVTKRFRPASKKLEFVADTLGIGNKVQHAGMPLWTGVMAGDPKAWATMRRYNMQDVVLTEQLYDRLLPWIPAHPNHNLYRDESDPLGCPRCAAPDSALQKRGKYRTATCLYQRWQCTACGGWQKSTQREAQTYRTPI